MVNLLQQFVFTSALVLGFWPAKVALHPILEKCVKAGLGSGNLDLLHKFSTDYVVVKSISKYLEISVGPEGEKKDGLFFQRDEIGKYSKFFFDRNEAVVDQFWDSMMVHLPKTWHIYGLRPVQMSIIKTRFSESCAGGIFSLLKDGIIEKYHTAIPNLKDKRYLTMGKVMEICRDIQNDMEDQGFELVSGVPPFGRSSIPVYYRCSSPLSDVLADLLLYIADHRIPKSEISKKRACSMTEVMVKDSETFQGSCKDVLPFGLRGYIPLELDFENEVAYICEILGNLRQFGVFLSDEVTPKSKVSIKEVVVESLLKAFPELYLTEEGENIVNLTTIKESRFVESCANFSETLIALRGLALSSRKSPEAYPDLENLRSKLLLVCSGIHMYLLETKPKGIPVSKILNTRKVTNQDFSKLIESKFIPFDSCGAKLSFLLGKYTISQDTLAEMILSIIQYSSPRSSSSTSLNNGLIKEPICEISALIIGSMKNKLLSSLIYEEAEFFHICRQIIFNKVLGSSVEANQEGNRKTKEFSNIRKSVIKLCNILSKSLNLISSFKNQPTRDSGDQENRTFLEDLSESEDTINEAEFESGSNSS
ncbi:putative integral membrane protein [Cryptosporidium felis]|nr:putative integral membrane protein [Cryptosporidium felis]